MCYTISFLSRNIDLEINFFSFHIYLKCSAEKSKREKIRFQLWIVMIVEHVFCVLTNLFSFRFGRRKFAFLLFSLEKWKYHLLPLFLALAKFEYLNEGDGKGRENVKWAFAEIRVKEVVVEVVVVVVVSARQADRHWEENGVIWLNSALSYFSLGRTFPSVYTPRRFHAQGRRKKFVIMKSSKFRRVEKVKWKGKCKWIEPLKLILNRFGDVYKYEKFVAIFRILIFPFARKFFPFDNCAEKGAADI